MLSYLVFWLGSSACDASILNTLPNFPNGTSLYTQYTPTISDLEPLEPIRWIPRVEGRDLPHLDLWNIGEYQVAIDNLNVLHSPSVIMGGEWVPVNSSVSIMHMSEILANRFDTVIMIADNNPFDSATPAVAKYQVDLNALGGIHPLIMEYAIMKYIDENFNEDDGIIPKVYFVSPAVRLVGRRTFRVRFGGRA